jgi:hypothetical protein
LELCEGVVDETAIDDLCELGDVVESGFPVSGEDLAGKFTPRGLAFLVVVGGLTCG